MEFHSFCYTSSHIKISAEKLKRVIMKTFQELYLNLNGVKPEELAGMLDSKCDEVWSRNIEAETKGSALFRPYCYTSSENDYIESALLVLFNKVDEKDTWYVSNIVPQKKNQLTHDEYNVVLQHFYKNVVCKAINGSPVTATLTSDEISINSIAGEKVARALRIFSELSNKSTGSAHPQDRKRWFEFLVLAHESSEKIDTDLIIQTLIEQGWSEEKASDLGIEYEFAEDLLNFVQES